MARFCLVYLLLLFTCTLAQAGNGWVSSGGDLYKSDKNAWFLKNTKTVTYCSIIDGKGISLSAEKVKSDIAKAIRYWRREFDTVEEVLQDQKPGVFPGLASIGTQEFTELPTCDGSEDLRFVIGAGALTLQQRDYLKDVRRHLGAAVRTSYDFEQLRGRGFIFIASDIGAEKFNGSNIFNEKLWTKKNFFVGTVVHELGHVFGLPHFGTGLMSESFAEKIASSIFTGGLVDLEELPTILRPPEGSNSCNVGADVLEFFGVVGQPSEESPMPQHCLRLETIRRSTANEPTVMKLFVVKKDSSSKEEVAELSYKGEIKVPDLHLPFDLNMSFTSLVYLSDKQKVFSEAERVKVKDARDKTGKTFVTLEYMIGAIEMSFGFTAQMVKKNREVRSVFIHFSPQATKILGELNGETRLLFKSDQMIAF